MSDLNLLPNVAKFQVTKIQLRLKARKITILIVIGWIASLAATYGVWYGFTKRVEAAQQKYDLALADLKAQDSEIKLTQQLKHKSKLVGQVLDQRFEYSEVFERLSKLWSSEIKIINSELEGNNVFSITGVVSKIGGLSEIENKVTMAKNGQIEGVAAINIDSLSYDLTKGWLFSLEVVLK